ncbi:MAG: metallophosphoesterase [Bacteroidia bacterium]|nr:metallophosphoesterase [Bacteroidia bacterium]
MIQAFQIKLAISFISFAFIIDLYSWQAVRALVRDKSEITKKIFAYIYWFIPLLVFIYFMFGLLFPGVNYGKFIKIYFPGFYFVVYISKFVVCIFLIFDDLKRLLKIIWRSILARNQLKNLVDPTQGDVLEHIHEEEVEEKEKISRSQFLATTGLLVSAAPLIILSRGIIKGAYDYRVRRIQLYLPNLPSGFEGVKLLQISDVHTGSFTDRDAVYKGIQMIKQENADLIFFTGDLVNSMTNELYDWQNIFAEIKAPMGVFSIYGNHDYGDYVPNWESQEAKEKNLADLAQAHKNMGWNLLRNEHLTLTKNNQRIGIVGVENWGDKGRFQKYGDIEKATKNMPDVPVKLLLSHDPSHFDKIISKNHKDIDVTFSGHTHGFQFGVEIGNFKWSPSQYIYPYWAGLYNVGNQQVYVNRGFGFLGYPGRVGILPEITVFTLTKNS